MMRAGADWYFEWLDHPEDGPYWDALDVGPRLGGEQRKGVAGVVGIGRHRPAKQNQSSPA